jgi:hypothetical protein
MTTSTEAIVVASLAALLTVTGIKALSPEAQASADTVKLAARVQDWKWAYASEISGRDYTAGISSPINIDEAVDDIKASGILENIEAQAEAEAAEARWNSTQNITF